MLRKSVLCLGLSVFAYPAWAADPPPSDEARDDEQSLEELSESEKALALEYTQKEMQDRFQNGFGLNLGQVMPWSDIGTSFLTKFGGTISSISLGSGSFDYSGNLNARNYVVEGDAQSAFLAARFFVLGFGPLYVEPLLGLVQWTGQVKPRGTDNLDDIAASSLTSRFEMLGLDAGANFGLMWIFKSGVFLDGNLISLSHALLLRESYTVSTADARKAVRAQIAGPISMSNVNIRIGYALDF